MILATSTAYQLTIAELSVRSAAILAKLGQYSTENGWGDPTWRLPTGAPYCPVYDDIPIVGPILYAACVGFQGIRSAGALEALGYVAASMLKYNPPGLISKSHDIISAMNDMNDYLVDSFPERVGNEALHLARLDDVDHVVFHPACDAGASCNHSKEGQGGDLPVERNTAESAASYYELCTAMTNGTQSYAVGLQMRGEFAKRGFPIGKGPLTAGGTDGRHIRDFVNDKSGTDTQLPAFYEFYEAFGPGYYTSIPVKSLIEQFSGDLGWFGDILIDGAEEALKDFTGIDLGVVNPFQLPIDSPPRYEDAQRKKENDFTRKFDKTWNQVCGVGGGIASLIGVLPKPYWLKGRPIYAMDPLTVRATGDQLKPYKALVVVSRAPRVRLQAQMFRDKTPAFAYAESWVHNYTSFDLYTQDWLASLAPTSLVDDVSLVSQTIKRSPAADSYKALTSTFDKGGANAWSTVNTH
ncbi:hypothetical protein GGD46_004349 [Rhizobium lusitanum]|uniref:Uncharacterized protein n=1 Tax=Rhizobium lusitanum TaxID=293958 RepID=A0A7X0IUG2_9HYPH|nr:hypothetical protein [Rhizobium lusitanum]